MSESKVKKTTLSFPVMFEKVNEITSGDTRFTKLKCWLMHTNENYNGSSFSKEVIEKALPTLAYIPVVGFLENNDIGEEDFSDHRYIITKDDNGVRRKYMGSAYGVILSSEDNNAHFETKMCDDGIEREFIVADAVAWNFLEDSSQILNRDLIKDHSIELDENSVQGYEDERGLFHFTSFSFRAACVLGGKARPAMEGSVVEVVNFSMNDFADFARNIQDELINKYSEFTKLANETKSVDLTDNNTFTELKMVNEKINGGVENMDKTVFENISAFVKQHETFTNRFGTECPRYYTVGIQDNEVIVVDAMNDYNHYGLSFTLNDGGKAEIDFENAKKKQSRYEDYVDGSSNEDAFNFGKHIAEIEDIAFTKVDEANVKVTETEGKIVEFEAKISEYEIAKNELETNYNQIKAEFDEIKPKYDDYVKAEQARIEAELDAQKDAVFAKYEPVLADDADFAALKEKKAEMTAKEIEAECAILYVRKNFAQANFSKSNNDAMVAGLVEDSNKEGFVETRYGFIKTSR